MLAGSLCVDFCQVYVFTHLTRTLLALIRCRREHLSISVYATLKLTIVAGRTTFSWLWVGTGNAAWYRVTSSLSCLKSILYNIQQGISYDSIFPYHTILLSDRQQKDWLKLDENRSKIGMHGKHISHPVLTSQEHIFKAYQPK